MLHFEEPSWGVTMVSIKKTKTASERRLCWNFQDVSGIGDLLTDLSIKIWTSRLTCGKHGSGRPKRAAAVENEECVEEQTFCCKNIVRVHTDLHWILLVTLMSFLEWEEELEWKPIGLIPVSRRDLKIWGKTGFSNLNYSYSETDVEKIEFTHVEDFTLVIAENHTGWSHVHKKAREVEPTQLYHKSSS